MVCRPLPSAWNPSSAGGCDNEVVVFVVSEVIGLVIDVMILVFPLVWISRLHMKATRKMKIGMVFSLGGV